MIYNRKMSKTMKQKACEMREDGYTLQEIGEEMGVSWKNDSSIRAKRRTLSSQE